MTFLSSGRLALLAVPIALLVAYLVVQRTRPRAAVRFTSVELLASVAPRRPGWQRHLPAGALLAALGVLVLGFAQPAHALRTPRQRATVMLALDTSASMGATDVSPTRLAAAQTAAREFVGRLPAGVQLGLISFDRSAQVRVVPTSDRSAVRAAIDQLQVGPGTATGDAIYLALDAIAASPATPGGKPAPAAIVLMSDGTPTVGRGDQTPAQTVVAAADQARQAQVPISTIAFGTQSGTVVIRGQMIAVPADPSAMAAIAQQSGGRFFTAETAGQLKSVYEQIRRVVGFDVHQHEITAWFTGVALVMAMLAAGGALIWSQRMV